MMTTALPRFRRTLLALILLPLAAQPAKPAETTPAAGQVSAPASPPVALYLTWQRDPTTTMTVHWHTEWTAGFSDSVIEYRAAAEGGDRRESTPWQRASGKWAPMPFTNRMVHTVELTGLSPGTAYEFRLGRLITQSDATSVFEVNGPAHRFRTLPKTLERPLRFISGGDGYANAGDVFEAMTRTAAARDPEFAIMGGDIAYANGSPQSSDRWFEFFRIWREAMVGRDGRLIPIVPAIGNHETHGDTYRDRGGAPNRGISTERAPYFYSVFAFPGRPGYNVLDAGDYLSVIVLDTFHTNPVPGPQTDWLRGVLDARRHVSYVIPVYHVPAYPAYRSFSTAVSAAIRANWIPLFDAAGIRFVFENHDHTYKVTHPLRAGQRHPSGTRYLGDGAWGVNTRKPSSPEKAPYLERAQARNHVYVVTLHPDRADFVAVDPAGEEFDRFSISKKPAVP